MYTNKAHAIPAHRKEEKGYIKKTDYPAVSPIDMLRCWHAERDEDVSLLT